MKFIRKCFIPLLFVFSYVKSSHFRGGLLTWKAVNETEITVHHRVSYTHTYCSGSSRNDPLTCNSGCNASFTMVGYCTNANSGENWADIEGETRLTITNPTSTTYNLSVNACSLTTRDMKSIKKKWVDIQSQARKKEAGRRREQKKTGGGPPPPSLKPWEDKIISMLDVSLITGLEGGYDAAEHPAIPGPSSCAAASTSLEPLKSFALSSSAVDSTPECDPKLQSRKKRPAQDIASTSDLSMSLLDIQKEKLNMKREFLEVEKKKLKVMEGMLQEMKQKNCCCSFPMDPFNQMQSTSKTASCSVSPTIKGLIISEI